MMDRMTFMRRGARANADTHANAGADAAVRGVAGRFTRTLAAASLALALGACGTLHTTAAPTMAQNDIVVIAPMANFTETPDAGHSAESISANALRNSGIAVQMSPATTGGGTTALFGAGARPDMERTLSWARSQKAHYVLSGAVEEWRYKTGVDGEPVVGITLELTDVNSAKVVWSATGTRSGFSRSSLSTVATRLIFKTLAPLTQPR